MRESDLACLLQVAGANLGVFVLSLIGIAVAAKLTWGSLFFFLFIISLLQGGLMIPAFSPAFGNSRILTLENKVIGWIGFIGWFLTYLVIAGVIAVRSLNEGFWVLGAALFFFFLCHTLTLISFYRQCFGITSRQPMKKKSQKSIEQEQRTALQQEQRKQQQQTDQQKRDEARLSCLLFYDQHANDLATRFPRERMMDYFSQYLTDSLPVELIEQRSELLKEMIESSMNSKNQKKFSSFNEIAVYFQEQKKEIESLDYDDATKQSFLSSLHHQENVAIREFLS